jgi:hypothetical protein
LSVRLARAPQTRDELYWLVKTLWGHTIPRHKVCEEHQAPFDAFAASYFAEEPQILIHGSRGLSGKSRLMSLLGLTKAVVLGSDVNIVGGSLSQSINIHETMRDAWDSTHAPRYMVVSEGQQKVLLTNKAKIRPLTASQKTVRGPHPPNLLLDEIDEMDQAIFDAAKGQPMPQKNWLGQVIPAHTAMASTWQYPDKTFAAEYQRFKEEDLPIYTWCYKDTSNEIDGWLDPDFIEQKRREIPKEMWRVEYDLGEPSIGNRAFDTDAVERMFAANAGVEPRKINREYQEWVFEQYQTAEEYVIAADWAKEQDWTVITVWKCTKLPMQLVYYIQMKRRPYPVMIEAYNKLFRHYHAEGIHDATGLGNVVTDYLDDRVQGFQMRGEKRANMLTEYVSAVERDRVRAPKEVNKAYLAHKYCSVEDMYSSAKEFHLPDEVCSSALAWHLVARRPIAADPIVIPSIDISTYIEEGVKKNTKRKSSPWEVGTVTRKTEENEMSFMA